MASEAIWESVGAFPADILLYLQLSLLRHQRFHEVTGVSRRADASPSPILSILIITPGLAESTEIRAPRRQGRGPGIVADADQACAGFAAEASRAHLDTTSWGFVIFGELERSRE